MRGGRHVLEHVADRRLEALGLAPQYGTANPFGFMEFQDVQELSNFFERRVSAYQVAVTGTVLRLRGRGLIISRPKSAAGERVLQLPVWCLDMLHRRERSAGSCPTRRWRRDYPPRGGIGSSKVSRPRCGSTGSRRSTGDSSPEDPEEEGQDKRQQ